jgi:hypothetical protein
MNFPLFVNPHSNPLELKRTDTLNPGTARADRSGEDESSAPVKASAIRKFEEYFAENLVVEESERPKKRRKAESATASLTNGVAATILRG